MLRTVVRLTPAIIPFFNKNNAYDYDMLHAQPPKPPETGFERVKKMYSYTTSECEDLSVELHSVIQTSLCGAFIGACIGGFVQSKASYIYFIENNQATIFKSTMQAKKKLQDFVTVAFAKGAVQWGWRLGAFTGLFSLIATTISVYRNDTSLIEYVTAGALTGAIYKANLGLAAMLVGAGLGAALSTVGGLAVIILLNVTGISMEDIRRAVFNLSEARIDQYNQAVEKSSEIKNDALTLHHDAVVAERGKGNIENI